ncbi:MAG TPA: GNAT family protein [Candidatus Limnocylindria bacterium]|jgi:RimJ/RimL family protein N-acetyltransferase|nr:GNAT family protein [Candidatus Limnocylindria bacterium]
MPDEQPPSTPSLPILRGERIYLRPAERADLPTFVRWFSDAETGRNLTVRSPVSMPIEEQWYEKMLAKHGKSQYHFVICLLGDGRPIGTIGFHDVDYENGGAEFGIAIGEKDEWNKGYGTDAVNAICDFGFGALRLERIELGVYAGNARARRAYEKAGFVFEGALRRAHFNEGEYVDVECMALLRDEWLRLPRRKSWQYAADEATGRAASRT